MDRDGSGRLVAAEREDRDGGMFARNSVSVVGWTAVSRLSGFVRIAVVAAVLGPTYLGNVFQATNNLPVIAYAALAGSLFSNLLVPPLVRHVDAGDRAAAARLAGAFLTAALAAFAVVCALLTLAAPMVLRLLAVGVPDPAAAAAQRRVGLVLLVLFLPQMMMYAVIGTAEAVMNAHGRFALPAAAPILENVGTIATMVVTALVYGTGDRLAAGTTGQLLLLGVGATSAVALHATVQWCGARSVGVTLRPRAPWREPELRGVLRRATHSLGFSVVDVVQPMGAMVVANRVPGGVIAFQLAYSLYALPPAMGTRPVAVALLPRLARLAQPPDLGRFRDELNRGAALVAFLIVPAAVAYLTLHRLLADALTFGQMAAAPGRALVATCVAALAPGLLGYAALLLSTYACYAQRDARSPLRAALLRAAVAAAGMVVAVQVPAGAGALLALGLAISAADIAGGSRLAVRLHRVLPAASGERLIRPLLRTLAASVLMAGPAYLAGVELPRLLAGSLNAHLSMVVAAATGAGVYFLLQRWWRSPELALIRAGLRPGDASPGSEPSRTAKAPL